MEKSYISAAIVNYNSCEDAINAAYSVKEHTKLGDLVLYLIDNGSSDESKEKFAAINDEVIRPIILPKNIGFGGGHNEVLGRINSKYHAVINPDITLETDTLQSLCQYMDQHPDLAIITPELRGTNGKTQLVAKRNPALLALIARQLPCSCLKKYEKNYLMSEQDLSVPVDVEFCSGCFFVIRTDVFKKINGFDRRYFLYFEDADITREARKHGRAVYYPHTYVVHRWNRATRKNAKHFFMQLKSMFIYFDKWRKGF